MLLKKHPYCIKLFYLIFSCLILAQGKVDGVAAIVGKNIILHSDVLQQAQYISIERGIDPSKNPFSFEEIYISTLDGLINQYVLLEVAEKDTNIFVSKEEVDRSLDQQIENLILRAGSEQIFLEYVGMSMRQVRSEYWKNIRDMMLIEKYQYSKLNNVDVSRKEVESFYNAYKDSLPAIPESFSFSVIESPYVASIISENTVFSFLDSLKSILIKNPQQFDSLAIKFSHDPGTAEQGGYLGFTNRGTLVKEFEEKAYSLSVNDIAGPIKSPFGYHLIKLLDKQGEKISTQHILRTITVSPSDKNETRLSIKKLLSFINNDTFVFDSIAIDYSNKHNNSSGVFKNKPVLEISTDIFSYLNNNYTLPFISPVLESENGFRIILIYQHNKKEQPTLDNSWNIIYQYAKNEKETKLLTKHIEKIKNKIFIKVF